MQGPKNNKFRKTISRLGQENPKKEVEPIAPNSEAESQKIYYTPIQVKKINLKRKLSPLPYAAGECSSSGSRQPGGHTYSKSIDQPDQVANPAQVGTLLPVEPPDDAYTGPLFTL